MIISTIMLKFLFLSTKAKAQKACFTWGCVLMGESSPTDFHVPVHLQYFLNFLLEIRNGERSNLSISAFLHGHYKKTSMGRLDKRAWEGLTGQLNLFHIVFKMLRTKSSTLCDRRIVGWQPPHCWVATATLLDGDRHTVGWRPPHCSLTLLVDYFKPYF